MAEDAPAYQVYVKLLPSRRTFSVMVKDSWLIGDVKKAIEVREGLPCISPPALPPACVPHAITLLTLSCEREGGRDDGRRTACCVSREFLRCDLPASSFPFSCPPLTAPLPHISPLLHCVLLRARHPPVLPRRACSRAHIVSNGVLIETACCTCV